MAILLQASDLDDFLVEDHPPKDIPTAPFDVAEPIPAAPDFPPDVQVLEDVQVTPPPSEPTTETPAPSEPTTPTPPVAEKPLPTQDAVLAEITQQDKVAQEAKMRWLSAQERVKGARENAKALQEIYLGEMARLHEIIQGHRNDADRPLFADAACAEGDDGDDDGVAVDPPVLLAAQPGAWREAQLEVLNLKPALHAKLIEHDITTIGKLEDLRASFDGLKSIKGIGQGKADQIEEAVIEWLTKNRDSEIFKDQPAPAAEAAEQPAEQLAEQTEAPATEPPATIPMHNPRPTVLAARLNDLRQESHAVLKHQDAWQAGVLARSEAKGVESCEENEAERIDDWIRGWLAQDSNG